MLCVKNLSFQLVFKRLSILQYFNIYTIFLMYYTFFYLKVPKRKIFDRSDFPDFYTIKSLCVGDLGVKIKIFFNNNYGFIWGCKVPYTYAQCIFKEVIFLSFGQKKFFSVELLRSLVSVNNDFFKFFIY